MPPKAAEPQANLANRPQTPNDIALVKTEAALQDAATTESKWRQRQQDSTRESAKTRLHATLGRINIEACQRLIEELDKCVEGALLNSRGDAAGAAAAPAAGKDAKKGAPKDAAPAKPPQEVQDVLDILLRFYRFDGRPAPLPPLERAPNGAPQQAARSGAPVVGFRRGEPERGPTPAASNKSTPLPTRGNTPSDGRRPEEPVDTAVAELVGAIRERVRAGWHDLVEPGEEGYSCTKALAVTSALTLAAVGLEEPPPPQALRVMPLPPLRGIDRALWTKVMQLRDQRLLVVDAQLAFEREQVPLATRGTTLLTINDLAAYALNACQRGRRQLEGALQQQEQVRQQEISKWLEEQKAGDAKAGKK